MSAARVSQRISAIAESATLAVDAKANFFARIALFIRQIIGELKKVVAPTRKELINYTLVVLVFVGIMMVIVSLLDIGFGTAVGWVFGGTGTTDS